VKRWRQRAASVRSRDIETVGSISCWGFKGQTDYHAVIHDQELSPMSDTELRTQLKQLCIVYKQVSECQCRVTLSDGDWLTKTAIEKNEKAITASLALLFLPALVELAFLHESARKQKHTNHRNVHSPTTKSVRYATLHGSCTYFPQQFKAFSFKISQSTIY